MEIRRATQRDLKVIDRYSEWVQKEATLGYSTITKNMNSQELHYMYQSYYLVLADHDEQKGWVLVGQTRTLNSEVAGIILELYVIPAYRKQGYGKLLMSAALKEFERCGYKVAQLNVFNGNEAVKLYEKLGFKGIVTLMEKRLY